MENNSFTIRQIEIIEAATSRIDRYGIQELTIKNLAADIELSEAALYRHFKSKNDILVGLLSYFILKMKERLAPIIAKEGCTPTEQLKELFNSQLQAFTEKPAIVSVIFSEGIFQFNDELNEKVSVLMEIMQANINDMVKRGQEMGTYRELIGSSTVTTIIMGSMRLTVLKWKLSRHQSNLIKDGNTVLNGLLKMIEI